MTAFVLLLALGQYTPQEAQALFVEANDAYYQGDYAAAQLKYARLLEAGQGGADVLFNLGTTHLAQGELGPAVLYLERARRLSADDDIEANLAIARKRQVDQVVGEDVAVPFTQRLAAAVDERFATIAFLALSWLALALFLVWKVRAEGRRLLVGLACAAAVFGAAVAGGLVGLEAWAHQTFVEAVVMPTTVKVLEFPGASARVSFEVHAGLKVRVMETSGRYVRLRLPNALEGWVEKTAVIEL